MPRKCQSGVKGDRIPLVPQGEAWNLRKLLRRIDGRVRDAARDRRLDSRGRRLVHRLRSNGVTRRREYDPMAGHRLTIPTPIAMNRANHRWWSVSVRMRSYACGVRVSAPGLVRPSSPALEAENQPRPDFASALLNSATGYQRRGLACRTGDVLHRAGHNSSRAER